MTATFWIGLILVIGIIAGLFIACNDNKPNARIFAQDGPVGAYRQKEREYNRALRIEFPPGTVIKWEFGGKTRTGTVLKWGFGSRLKVESSTGKQYWLNACGNLAAKRALERF